MVGVLYTPIIFLCLIIFYIYSNIKLHIIHFCFFINMSVRISLRVPRLVPRALKLPIMYPFSGPEVCETRIDDLKKANLKPDQLSYTPQNLLHPSEFAQDTS